MSAYQTKFLLENDPTSKRLKVITRTSDYSLGVKDTGAVCTNLGAAGTVTFTLPAGRRVGDNFTFSVATAQILRIDPGDASDTITDNATGTNGAGQYIQNNYLGGHIKLVYIGSNRWISVSEDASTWTHE